MKKLNDSPGEWLLVDFFSLSSPRAHRIGDHYFTDFRGLIADALHAEKYSFWMICQFPNCSVACVFMPRL